MSERASFETPTVPSSRASARASYALAILLWLVAACPAAVWATVVLRHQPRSLGGQLVVLPVMLALFAALELGRRGKAVPWLLLAIDFGAALTVVSLARSMLL